MSEVDTPTPDPPQEDPESQQGSRRRRPVSDPIRRGETEHEKQESLLGRYSWLLLVGLGLALVFSSWVLALAILGLALLILVHEFGHFIFAKMFGMRVEKFYIGFSPAAAKKTWGETEYGVGWIPLGGFCKISGMTPEEEVPEGTGDRVYYKKPVWQRNLTIFGGPLMNFIAAAVIIFFFLLVAGVPEASLTIDSVMPGTPAAKIGLQPGDTLVGADGQRWSEWSQATAFLQANPNRTVELTYTTANGQEKTVTVGLISNPNDKRSGYLGVRVGETTTRPDPASAAWTSVTTTGDVIYRTFEGFYLLFSGKINPVGENGAVGPVGIVSVSQQAVRQHWYPLFLAFISVNLGIINLLPILPFDGGHIFFNTLERIRGGRRVDSRVIERVVAVSVALLVTLFVFLTFNDISRLISG
ncbi:MAG TPA: M50 family metallopeptidase [Thermoleophilia bacterium]|nr:M50 family metallopeptidase [Thermoleophilia bacterium]